MTPESINAARSVYGPIIDTINRGGRFLVVWPDLLPFVVNEIDPAKHFVTGMVIVDLTKMVYTVNGEDWFDLVLEE